MRTCHKCGFEILEGKNICNRCGTIYNPYGQDDRLNEINRTIKNNNEIKSVMTFFVVLFMIFSISITVFLVFKMNDHRKSTPIDLSPKDNYIKDVVDQVNNTKNIVNKTNTQTFINSLEANNTMLQISSEISIPTNCEYIDSKWNDECMEYMNKIYQISRIPSFKSANITMEENGQIKSLKVEYETQTCIYDKSELVCS